MHRVALDVGPEVPPLVHFERLAVVVEEIHASFVVVHRASQDDRRQGEKKMQGLTDDFIKKVEEMTAQKEEEILQV